MTDKANNWTELTPVPADSQRLTQFQISDPLVARFTGCAVPLESSKNVVPLAYVSGAEYVATAPPGAAPMTVVTQFQPVCDKPGSGTRVAPLLDIVTLPAEPLFSLNDKAPGALPVTILSKAQVRTMDPAGS
jgi:hypothetical protein